MGGSGAVGVGVFIDDSSGAFLSDRSEYTAAVRAAPPPALRAAIMASEDFDMVVEAAVAAARGALPGIYSLSCVFVLLTKVPRGMAGDRDLTFLSPQQLDGKEGRQEGVAFGVVTV